MSARGCVLTKMPHRGFHLTAIDLAAFLVLLSLETGMEMECLIGLKADCLRNATKGYVEIDYYKRTKIFQIMHTVIIRRDMHEKHPFLASALYGAFDQSKNSALKKM